MNIYRHAVRSTLASLGVAALIVLAPSLEGAGQDAGGARTTLAITYGEGSSSSIDMAGSTLRPGVLGSADVKRSQGRTRVKIHMEALPHPQSLGSFYTTYLLWAVAPEGQSANLAELPHSKSFSMEVTTSFQTFGLIVTAEPHSAVSLPSPIVIAENVVRDDTAGRIQASPLAYGAATGSLYLMPDQADAAHRDFVTPLLVLGARHAVDIAKDAGADHYARAELQQAETKLATIEQAAHGGRKLPRDFEGDAREAMRIAENARQVAEDRHEQARLSDERNAANATVAAAQSEAERAREETKQTRQSAEQARSDAEQARVREGMARVQAESARQEAELARQDAESALREADATRRDKAEMQERLFQSLSTILETRREARGIIVNLSDVLFDFNRASLTPGAREKLSKLTGLLLAYPGSYRLEIEGHADAIGSEQYNFRLSRDRAEMVGSYLVTSGLPAGRIGATVGMGEDRPVASNDTASGRQLNRRVEVVITDLDT